MAKNKKRILFFSLLYGISIFSVFLYHKIKNRPRPNVIVFMVDTLRAEYMGCYGFPVATTPFIDEFAKESVLFENARSQAPWTKPSVASFFTSLYVPAHRVKSRKKLLWLSGRNRLATEVVSSDLYMMAEAFQKEGYHTVAFAMNSWLKSNWGFNQGFDIYVEPKKATSQISDAYVIWRQSLSFLAKLTERKPFFIYYHFIDPHYPYTCPDPYFSQFKDSPAFGKNRFLTKQERRARRREIIHLNDSSPNMNPQRLKDWKVCYAVDIRLFDDQFRKIIGEMKDSGMLKNTIVIFTSDHGEEFLDHGYWAHGKTLHSELINVPLLVRLPGGRHGGKRVTSLVELIDIFPTLASLLGFDQDLSFLQGKDISSLLNGKDRPVREWSFSSGAYHDRLNSVENRATKFIWWYPKEKFQLFDLRMDPKALKNIAPENPDRIPPLKELLDRVIKESRKKRGATQQDAPMTDEEIEKLKSLGYLQ